MQGLLMEARRFASLTIGLAAVLNLHCRLTGTLYQAPCVFQRQRCSRPNALPFQRLVPALNLAVRLWMIRGGSDVVPSSYLRSVILTEERFLQFQLRRDKPRLPFQRPNHRWPGKIGHNNFRQRSSFPDETLAVNPSAWRLSLLECAVLNTPHFCTILVHINPLESALTETPVGRPLTVVKTRWIIVSLLTTLLIPVHTA